MQYPNSIYFGLKGPYVGTLGPKAGKNLYTIWVHGPVGLGYNMSAVCLDNKKPRHLTFQGPGRTLRRFLVGVFA